jgi:SAM-dependent methyltransferase
MSKHSEFWNKEYRSSEHLALSDEPAEDLEKFCRWAERNYGRRFLNPLARALDLGCGNGRNLIFLAQTYGMRGVGYDISSEAIKLASRASKDLPIIYTARSIEGTIELADSSIDIVLDMMTSHFLKEKERELLRKEVLRVLKPGGWLFFKSFLADQDLHVRRLLKESPADEKDSYIHPKFGVYEHVWTEESLHEFFSPFFAIEKIERSHKHMKGGKAFKRRTVVAYLQKPF